MIVWCRVEDCEHRDAEHGLCTLDQIWIDDSVPYNFTFPPACTDYDQEETEDEE